MTPPYPIHSVDFREELDIIDDNHWGLWLIDLYLTDGTCIRDCSVQSDGYSAAWETLEDENGNALDIATFAAPPLT